MDTNTLITLYSGMQAYTMFLTNVLIPTGEKYDYILEKKYYNAASFSLVSCIMLAIKENIVEGSKDNFESKILYDNLIKAVNKIATKKSDGFYIKNHRFKDAASVVGELRNKLAHGNYKLDAQNGRVTFKFEEDEVIIKISTLSEMIITCLQTSLKNPKNNVYEREFIFSKNVDLNRKTPFKSEDELLRFANSIKVNKVTIKRKDNKDLDYTEVQLFEKMLKAYKESLSPQVITDFEKQLGKWYLIEIKPERIKYDILTNAAHEAYSNFNDNLDYFKEIEFLTSIIETKRKPELNIINSNLKNLLILKEISRERTRDINTILRTLKEDDGIDFISYNEVVTSSIALFQSLFSYGNDTFLKNKNEYTNLPNNGLDYSLLDLSKINVLYFTRDNSKLNELLLQIPSKNKKVKDLDKKITKSNESLKEVMAKNNTKATQAIQGNIQSLISQKQTIEGQIKTLYAEVNDIKTYEQNNKDHLMNRLIINAIRNSISHGNYKIESTSLNDIKVVFEDIHNKVLTFKCEIDIIDFINMLYENKNVIINFLDNQKGIALTRIKA